MHLWTWHNSLSFLPCWLLVSCMPHHLALIVYSRVSQPVGHRRILTSHSQVLLKFSVFDKSNLLTKTLVVQELHTTWYALFRHYALEIIATRKFPRCRQHCAQCLVTEDILTHTGGSCCHEKEIWKQAYGRWLDRHTMFSWLKTGMLQNNESYQINVVTILLGVSSYFRFL